MLVGPSKQLKRVIQTENNIVKNPNWQEANQLAIYKLGRGFELGATEKQNILRKNVFLILRIAKAKSEK